MTIPNIILNPERTVIADQLHNEMKRHGIVDYKIWPSVHISNKPKRTGISLAHKQIVEWALLEGLEEVCIMESDVWFPAEDGWQHFLDNKPKVPYDLYLGGVARGETVGGITTRFTGLFCYFISEAYFTTFLGVSEDLDIDGAMAGLGTFYVCEPYAAFCYPGWSDNQGGICDYSHLLVGKNVHGFGLINSTEDAKIFSELATSMKPK